MRSALGADFVPVPRAKWQLKGNTVTLEGGFEPGQTYELSYLAANPPVAGLGFAAVRDAAAWVKYAADATVSAKYTFAYGSSQTGRWLRDFLYEGFNTDERNRQAFDAVMPHIAGAGGIDLDRRWSTPTSLSMETVTRYPFSDRKQRDPVTGVEEGVLENVRAAEHQPKIFYTNSATEYWQRGLALAHTTPDGAKDVAPPDNVRMYSFSGSLAQHRPVSARLWPTASSRRIRSITACRCGRFSSRWNDGSATVSRRHRAGIRGSRTERSCAPPR